MTPDTVRARRRGWAARALAAALAAAALAGLALWIDASPRRPILSDPSDRMEQALDGSIVATMADFEMWNRLNIAVQAAAILLGLTATLLTASTTPANAERLKVATVTVTALTAALVTVQSTFHLRENLHTDATAFAALVTLESDYIYARDHPAEAKVDPGLLRRDTEQRLTRIRAARMLSLASIGEGAPRPERGGAGPGGE